ADRAGGDRRQEGDGRLVVGAARRRAVVRLQRAALPRELAADRVPPAGGAGGVVDAGAADPRGGIAGDGHGAGFEVDEVISGPPTLPDPHLVPKLCLGTRRNVRRSPVS